VTELTIRAQRVKLSPRFLLNYTDRYISAIQPEMEHQKYSSQIPVDYGESFALMAVMLGATISESPLGPFDVWG
jgi:hypothetical protein